MLDGTFGRGGHTAALLRAGAEVLALDQDPEALASPEATALRHQYGEKFQLMKHNFADLETLARDCGPFDAVLLDLGVSSPQLDQAARGFSFQQEGPLDMRMDPERPGPTAADIVNTWTLHDLTTLFRQYGEEPQAARVARAIVERRASHPFTTTTDLAAVIESAVGGRRGAKIHPATRAFQALRIAVNRELDALESALHALPVALVSGGTAAIISFHALEDRRVKEYFTRHSQPELRGPASPFGQPNPECFFHPHRRWLPTPAEIENNPRARSARLRAATRL